MRAFLELVAERILSLEESAVETAVILPNKRSIVFLRDILKKKTTQPFWLPEFYSLDAFMQEASGFSKAEPLQLALDLFCIHQKIAGNDHRSIEDFLSWAPIIVADFNDVDLNMADADQLFQHLSANKAIQEWNPDGRPLTTMQINYLNFYRSLLGYYQLLRTQLITNNQGYPGLIYRQLAEHFETHSTHWPWKHFLVAGINALSPAETLFFEQLNKQFKVDFLWDVDRYYFNTGNQQAVNPEPGRFIQSFIHQLNLPVPSNVDNQLQTDSKFIDIIGIQGEVAQTKYVAQWLEEQLLEVPKNQDQWQKTAIVLADEQLLVPLLDALPPISEPNQQINRYNITMGYPLKNSAFDLLIQQWVKLLYHMEQTRGSVLTLHLASFLRNPLISIIFNELQPGFSENICNSLISDNVYSLTTNELNELLKDSPATCTSQLKKLLTEGDGLTFIARYQMILEDTQQIQVKNQADLMESHQLNKAWEVTHTLSKIFERNQQHISLKAAEKILLQFIRRAQIHLVGEPLEGIQVMGLLETRNLDFDRILFLSCNEGFLPANDQMETFIPFDIRHQFHMPLPKDSQDVVAYHFYRLLKRAQHITYVHNTSTASLGSNDESRFLLQIENELAQVNPNIHIKRKQLNLLVDTATHQNKIVVDKTDSIINKLMKKAERGFSPSALNTYIICPLKFYFRYALGVFPEDILEQSMESNTFGSIVHGALEHMYKPLEGKQIDPNFLRQQMKSGTVFLETEYRKIFKGSSPIKGKNLLMMEVSKNMVNQTILSDCRSLEKEPRMLISVEEKVHATLDTKYGTFKLEGTIDRIDKIMNREQIRVIDYKTGRVLSKNLKINEMESLILNPDYSKAFQLMQYALMFSESHPHQMDIIAGNISLRNISQGFIGPIFCDNTTLSSNLPLFKKLITQLLETIFNRNLHFTQTENADACTYCDYRQICNKP